jgi:hypothetical protein
MVRVTVPRGLRDSPVRSTGPHGTGLHGPVLGERKTGPPLNRTVIGHETDTSLLMVRSTVTSRSGANWTGRSISNVHATLRFYHMVLFSSDDGDEK